MTRFILATFAILVLWPGRAAACSCGHSSFQETFREAALIFDGVARSTRIIADPDGGLSDLRLATTFEVTRDISRDAKSISPTLQIPLTELRATPAKGRERKDPPSS